MTTDVEPDRSQRHFVLTVDAPDSMDDESVRTALYRIIGAGETDLVESLQDDEEFRTEVTNVAAALGEIQLEPCPTQHGAAELPLADEARITEVLRDDGLDLSGTIRELKDSGGRLIDKCLETPVAVFRVQGDDLWWVATVELVISEAQPDLVAGLLDDTQ